MHLAEIIANGPELLHELPVLRRVAGILIRARHTGHEGPALLGGHDQSLAAQHFEPVPDGHRCDAELPGQLSLDRQPLADLVSAGCDRGAQVVSDPLVRRPLVPSWADWHGPTLPSDHLRNIMPRRLASHADPCSTLL